MRNKLLFSGGFFAIMILVSIVGIPVFAQGDESDFSGSQPAPAFPEGMDWINIDGALSWEDLRGKVVLLDFWTYGCINCIHVIPDLKQLEEEYAEELIVVGVHSAKFENEGITENIAQIVQRYEIEHPVINDSDFAVWREWGVRAWPTLILVDPEGNVFGYHEGEGVYQVLKPVIDGMVNQFDEAGLIDRTPIDITMERTTSAASLAFPGKVLADAVGNRLFIADTNNNRIIITTLDGYTITDVIGGPLAGNYDGDFATTQFDKPQGLALSENGQILYVADTENHTLRAVDLEAQTVATIAGTGQQARRLGILNGDGLDIALNSPWDLVIDNNVIYIAMAGSHQLWRYEIETGQVATHAGNGGESLTDNSLLNAQLAQPSGITVVDGILYFADSEASAIRSADTDTNGSVTTIVGTGLFDFGDADGTGDDVLLQHPLGITFGNDVLYIADTYNSKIKIVEPTTQQVTSLSGETSGGYADGVVDEALFDEPGGISFADGFLYVADTNNHAVRVIDIDAGTVNTIELANPELLAASAISTAPLLPNFGQDTVTMSMATVAQGSGGIELTFSVPDGYKLNTLTESSITWQADNATVTLAGDGLVTPVTSLDEAISFDASFSEGEAILTAQLNIFYCEAINESLCFVERTAIDMPITVSENASDSMVMTTYTIIPPVQ